MTAANLNSKHRIMNVKIADLMATNVVVTQPHKSIGHVKDIMEKNHISAVPVVNSDDEPVGIITSSDLHRGHKDSTPVSNILPEKVLAVPAYNDASVAARVMRKYGFHHVVVTHEKKIVGIISSFDLLKLIDGKRFVAKNAPSQHK
jgi:CBS domain-containing protein